MQTVVLVVHLMLVASLLGGVLLQRSDGGGLGIVGGDDQGPGAVQAAVPVVSCRAAARPIC